MIFVICSIIIILIWLLGIILLNRLSFNISIPTDTMISKTNINYHENSLLSVSESFLACKQKFENIPDYFLFKTFCEDKILLSKQQKESIKLNIYLCFVSLRPFLSEFNGKFSEMDFFCFVLILLGTDNKHSGELLNMSESSIRSTKTRLKGKLESGPLKLLYINI